jgi:hypothetical protein
MYSNIMALKSSPKYHKRREKKPGFLWPERRSYAARGLPASAGRGIAALLYSALINMYNYF